MSVELYRNELVKMKKSTDKGVCFHAKIEKLIGRPDDFIVIAARKNSLPSCSISKRYPKAKRLAQYVVRVYEDTGFFIVWNLQRRKAFHEKAGASVENLSLSYDLEKLDFNNATIIDIYQHLGNRGQDQPYEKILIVKMDFFEEFFLECDRFMSFNENDISFPHLDSDALKAANQWGPKEIRKRYSTFKLSRDANFRIAVLERFKFQCAICGCHIRSTLQAAHEHGYTVTETPYDNPEHGICLCANHHLLYDNDELEIDLENGTFTANNEIKDLKWFPKYITCDSGKLIK